MNFLIEWFARHHIAANMLVIATIICGMLAAHKIPKEIIPHTEPQTVTITSALPGASPSLIESSLCTPIENTLKSLTAIEHIRSSSLNNQCIVNISLRDFSDTRKTIADINAAINLLPLPASSTKPVIANTQREAIIARLSVSGLVDYNLLLATANKIVNELKALGINKVKVIEAKSRQTVIEIPQAQLQQYRISMTEIANVLRQNGLSIPGGHVDSSHDISSVVIGSGYADITELGNTVIRSLPDGAQLKLSDLATIRDELSSVEARVNGKPSIAIAIYQGSNTDIFDVSEITHGYVDSMQNALPRDINLQVIFDNAQFFDARMNYLESNFISGLLISSIILLLWLRLRLAFWITADIPIAFAGGIIWLYLMGGSINMVSAFGLIIVLGIVCDDAIVIGENIYRHQCSGKPGLEGAISGTQEVAKTVIFAVSTTVLMFIPLLFLPGSEGKLMQSLPMIVIAILIASLIEALLVLPTHLAHYKEHKKATLLGYPIAENMDKAVLKIYRPLLVAALKWRYSVFVICTALFLISLGLVFSGTVKVNFFSAIETEIATGAVSFPHSRDTDKTTIAVEKMEHAALELKQELYQEFGIAQIEHIRTFTAANAIHGEVYLGLAKSGNRKIDSHDVMLRWQEKTGDIPEASELSFNATVQVNSAMFNVLLHSTDSDALSRASAALKQQLQSYQGVLNSRDSFSDTHEEIRLELKPDALDMGLNLQTVSAQVHAALEGMTVSGTGQQRIVLQLPDQERNSLWHLQNLPIQTGALNTATLHTVPLSTIAHIMHASSPDSIQHVDGRQVSFISAQLDTQVISASALLETLEKDFLQDLPKNFPGTGWQKAGVLEAETTIKDYLTTSFMLSLLAMFILLSVFLGSYYQPFMIFTAIPFGIVGALLGHLLFAQPLTLWSIAGMIAVSGIVVNNNMMMIFFINERLKSGEDITNTILMAGADRFRPIMLTTVTTFAGVFPTIASNGWEAQFLIPLAISISCGVLFAAILTLFLVPCLYLITDDIKTRLALRFSSLQARK